jgi:hypothetical protein
MHDDVGGFPPPTIVGELGVDNIVATPEPATLLLVAGGLAAALVRRRRA